MRSYFKRSIFFPSIGCQYRTRCSRKNVLHAVKSLPRIFNVRLLNTLTVVYETGAKPTIAPLCPNSNASCCAQLFHEIELVDAQLLHTPHLTCAKGARTIFPRLACSVNGSFLFLTSRCTIFVLISSLARAIKSESWFASFSFDTLLRGTIINRTKYC